MKLEKIRLKDCPIRQAAKSEFIIGTDEDKSFVAIFDLESKLIFSTKDILNGKIKNAYYMYSDELESFCPESNGECIVVSINEPYETCMPGIYTLKGKQLLPPGRYIKNRIDFRYYGIQVKAPECNQSIAVYSYEGECLISEKEGYIELERDDTGLLQAKLPDSTVHTYLRDLKRISSPLPEGCCVYYTLYNGKMIIRSKDLYGVADSNWTFEISPSYTNFYCRKDRNGKQYVFFIHLENKKLDVYNTENFEVIYQSKLYYDPEDPEQGEIYANKDYLKRNYLYPYKPYKKYCEILDYSEGKVKKIFPVEEYHFRKIKSREIRGKIFFIVYFGHKCGVYLFEKETRSTKQILPIEFWEIRLNDYTIVASEKPKLEEINPIVETIYTNMGRPIDEKIVGYEPDRYTTKVFIYSYEGKLLETKYRDDYKKHNDEADPIDDDSVDDGYY